MDPRHRRTRADIARARRTGERLTLPQSPPKNFGDSCAVMDAVDRLGEPSSAPRSPPSRAPKWSMLPCSPLCKPARATRALYTEQYMECEISFRLARCGAQDEYSSTRCSTRQACAAFERVDSTSRSEVAGQYALRILRRPHRQRRRWCSDLSRDWQIRLRKTRVVDEAKPSSKRPVAIAQPRVPRCWPTSGVARRDSMPARSSHRVHRLSPVELEAGA
jgi:hypothetical protein